MELVLVWLDPTVNLSVLVTVLLAAWGYFHQKAKYEREATKQRVKLLQALRVEIKLNLEGLKDSLEQYPGDDDFKKVLSENRSYRPLILLHYTADIYRANVSLLSDLEPSLAGEIVRFYQTLAYLQLNASAPSEQAYVTISDHSRMAVIIRIREILKTAILNGENVLTALNETLPEEEGPNSTLALPDAQGSSDMARIRDNKTPVSSQKPGSDLTKE